ncbi:MAG: tetratricopeptide repeat protein [Sedimentisphaerales bacterium]|nr:tetratricopeptide repeat protein [Sedimentisphaerales bacterium]
MTHIKQTKIHNILRSALLIFALAVTIIFLKSYILKSGGVKGRTEMDISKITELIKKHPNDSDAYNLRGNYYSKKGDYDIAISDYTRAIVINPKNADIYHCNRGLAYSHQGEYSEAISDFCRAIEIHPKDAEYYYNRGNIRVKKGEYEGARLDYLKAIEISPTYSNASKNLSWLTQTYLNTKATDGRSVGTRTPENSELQPMGPFRYSGNGN